MTLLGSPPVSITTVLANYDGIDDESPDANHNKWIDVFSFGNSAEVLHNEDQYLRRGEVTQNDFPFHKRIHKCTPLLPSERWTPLPSPRLPRSDHPNQCGSLRGYHFQ